MRLAAGVGTDPGSATVAVITVKKAMIAGRAVTTRKGMPAVGLTQALSPIKTVFTTFILNKAATEWTVATYVTSRFGLIALTDPQLHRFSHYCIIFILILASTVTDLHYWTYRSIIKMMSNEKRTRARQI